MTIAGRRNQLFSSLLSANPRAKWMSQSRLTQLTHHTLQTRPLSTTMFHALPKHGNFADIQASRPEWNPDFKPAYHQTKDPNWTWGSGANDKSASTSQKKHIDIDPHEEGRSPASNYKLLISGIVPRPICFLSTRSKDGTSTNLAPFSYFQLLNHDPPMFCVGIVGGIANAKDSLKNLVESEECVINIISEHFVEAANSTSVDAPYGVSEWALSGLTPAASKDVSASRVQEAIFSVEAKLVNTMEFDSKVKPGSKSGTLAVLEGVRFWVREDAIDEARTMIDPAVLAPVTRLGGITYGRVGELYEITRPHFKDVVEVEGVKEKLVKPKAEGQ